MRVLVVDDHPLVREGLVLLLADAPDIEIVGTADTGRAALEQVRRLRPDLVLMDIVMPEMDGIEATRLICTKFPRTAVIGLSMFSRQEQAEAMRAAGATEYVTKDIQIETLIAIMRDCYAARRHLRRRPYH